jgi:hypothetical protein
MNGRADSPPGRRRSQPKYESPELVQPPQSEYQALFFDVMALKADQHCSMSWLPQCGQRTSPPRSRRATGPLRRVSCNCGRRIRSGACEPLRRWTSIRSTSLGCSSRRQFLGARENGKLSVDVAWSAEISRFADVVESVIRHIEVASRTSPRSDVPDTSRGAARASLESLRLS